MGKDKEGGMEVQHVRTLYPGFEYIIAVTIYIENLMCDWDVRLMLDVLPRVLF